MWYFKKLISLNEILPVVALELASLLVNLQNSDYFTGKAFGANDEYRKNNVKRKI